MLYDVSKFDLVHLSPTRVCDKNQLHLNYKYRKKKCFGVLISKFYSGLCLWTLFGKKVMCANEKMEMY